MGKNGLLEAYLELRAFYSTVEYCPYTVELLQPEKEKFRAHLIYHPTLFVRCGANRLIISPFGLVHDHGSEL